MSAGFEADKREASRQYEAEKLKLEANLNSQLEKLEEGWQQKLAEARLEYEALHQHHATKATQELKNMDER